MKKVRITAAGRSGICPICDCDISYTGTDRLEEIHHWICDNCGATGKESFTYMERNGEEDDWDEWEDTEFVEHCYIRLKDGTSVELMTPETPLDPQDTQTPSGTHGDPVQLLAPTCIRSFFFTLPPFGILAQEIPVYVEYLQKPEPGILTYSVFLQSKSSRNRHFIGKSMCRCPVLYDLNQNEEEGEAIILNLLQTRSIMEAIQTWHQQNNAAAPSDLREQILSHMADLRKELQDYAEAEGNAASITPIEIAILTAEDLLQKLS